MRRAPIGCLLALACALGSGDLRAQDGAESPLLQQRAQHPLNTMFGLPAVASRTVPERGEWQLSVEHGNSFMGGSSDEEVLVLDGESTELVLRHRRRLGRCWHAEAALPLVFHSGGWADRAIDDWHELFGLPDAARDRYPEFELRYVWIDSEGRRRTLERGAGGPGDVQLAVQRPLVCGAGGRATRGAALGGTVARLGVKLPSGDPERLLGSGATDLYADLQPPPLSLGRHWRLGAAVGVLLPGQSELFSAPRDVALYGSVGASLRLHARWHALAQIDWHTPFHDSELRELGDFAALLGVGFRYRLAPGQRLELSIGEDVVVDTSPDIVGRVAWTWRPR